MQRYVLRRLLYSLVALFILSLIIFGLSRLSGDPVNIMLPPEATEEARSTLRQSLGLDQPLPVQYGIWLSRAVTGDFGTSFKSRAPVIDLIKSRLLNSVELASVAMLITILLGLPLGVIAAVKRGTIFDTICRVVAVLGQSLPAFWVGVILIQVFAATLKILPAGEMGGPDHFILPAFTLGFWLVAGITRLLRSSLLEVLDSESIKMVRIKGASERVVIWKHALKNALIPVLTFGGMYFAMLITGAILVEVVFAWPGVGRLVYEAILSRDFPTIQGMVMTTGLVVVVVNMIVDISYAYIDPRIRYN